LVGNQYQVLQNIIM